MKLTKKMLLENTIEENSMWPTEEIKNLKYLDCPIDDKHYKDIVIRNTSFNDIRKDGKPVKIHVNGIFYETYYEDTASNDPTDSTYYPMIDGEVRVEFVINDNGKTYNPFEYFKILEQNNNLGNYADVEELSEEIFQRYNDEFNECLESELTDDDDFREPDDGPSDDYDYQYSPPGWD